MVNPIDSNINSLQLLRAANAFKTSNIPLKTNDIADQSFEIEDKVTLDSVNKDIKMQSSVQNINFQGISNEKVNEIKDFAGKITENTITDEDISYGLKYGRSVLVDYSA